MVLLVLEVLDDVVLMVLAVVLVLLVLDELVLVVLMVL